MPNSYMIIARKIFFPVFYFFLFFWGGTCPSLVSYVYVMFLRTFFTHVLVQGRILTGMFRANYSMGLPTFSYSYFSFHVITFNLVHGLSVSQPIKFGIPYLFTSGNHEFHDHSPLSDVI